LLISKRAEFTYGVVTIFGQGSKTEIAKIGNAKLRYTLELKSLFVPKTSVLQKNGAFYGPINIGSPKKVFAGFWSVFLSQAWFTTQVSGGAIVAKEGPKYLQGGQLPPYFPRLWNLLDIC